MNKTILEGLRVLDLADAKGQLCGKLLADLGAEVIKVEPPEGDRSRRIGPFLNDVPHAEGSLYFASFNTNKKSIVLDLAKTEDRQRLDSLIASSNVLIDSFVPARKKELGLDYTVLAKKNRRLISASVTGFGQSGPYCDFQSSELVSLAMGGLMSISGEPDRPPLMLPCDTGAQLASLYAAYGVLVSLYEAQSTWCGQQVDVSIQETLAAEQYLIVNYSASADILSRQGSSSFIGSGCPYGIFRCLDGYVHMAIIVPRHWKDLVDWMGKPEALTDPVFENRHLRIANAEFIEGYVNEFLKSRRKQEVFEEAQRRHLAVTAVYTIKDFLDDPHIRSRELFPEIEHPYLGRYRLIRPPYLFSELPCESGKPAPLLGEHSAEILGKRLANGWKKYRTVPRLKPGTAPLAGIRVLDFSHAIAGPTTTKLLAEFGAEVIKVESEFHPDRGRISPDMDPRIALKLRVTYADLNRNKKSITLNMHTREGRELASRLIKECDIVVENFSPRVMETWGLDYPQLARMRPDIIMVRMSGFGCTGPRREAVGLAPGSMAFTGLFHLQGYPDRADPTGTPLWLPDYAHGVYGAIAVMAALLHRREIGKGQVIDLSQIEAMASFLGAAYLDFFTNGREGVRLGNRSVYAAPHGCYRCKGDDQWCAISVFNEEQWQSLVRVMGSPKWSQKPEFATMKERLLNQDSLDENIEAWTSQDTPYQVMRTLQKAGVPAGVVQSAEEIFMDPHLRERGFFFPRFLAETGMIEYPGPIVRLSNSPATVGYCPGMGEHNEAVLTSLLGMTREEIQQLVERHIIA